MKINAFPLLSAVVAGSLLTAVSCTNTDISAGQTTSTGELRVSAPFANQTTQFAFDLAKRVNAAEGQGKNFFISPLSLHMALGMIMNGANGQTAQEIQKTLKLDAQTLAEANQTYRNLIDNLPTVDPNVTVTLANSVWNRNTFPVETSFQNILKETFKADVSAQDFADPATVSKINGWASQKTNGKIPKVIEQIQPDNVMFLLNALYFKGDWKTRFNADQTVDSPFKLASRGETTVRMMRLSTDLRRLVKPTYAAFELPYGSDKYAMTVLLPSATTTAESLINGFSNEEWIQLQKDMSLGKFDIGLPKFTMNYEVKLNDVLSSMGMPTAFTNQADFTKINAQGGLTLSFVKQNTFVAVDEKGTEAAAVTTGGISVTSAPQVYLCDRPFCIRDSRKNVGNRIVRRQGCRSD